MTTHNTLIEKAIHSSVAVWAVVALLLWCVVGFLCMLGWTIGSFVSFAAISSLKKYIPQIFAAGADAKKAKLAFLKLSTIRLVLILLLLCIITLFFGNSFVFILGFVAGVILVQSVIFFITIYSTIKKHNDS